MTKKVELFSGKVLTVPPTDVSATRYKWLKLSEAEPSLGVPTVDGAFIYSDQTGARAWTTQLTTDAAGNLQTAGVSIIGNRIESRNPAEPLEISGGISGEVVVDSNLTITGTVTFSGEIDEVNVVAGGQINIGGNEVLNETTLGPSVTISSLEQVGTITVGTWEADPISPAYGGTGISNPAGITPGAVLYGDGLNPMKETKGLPFQVLQVDATGTPQFQGLDYGKY